MIRGFFVPVNFTDMGLDLPNRLEFSLKKVTVHENDQNTIRILSKIFMFIIDSIQQIQNIY